MWTEAMQPLQRFIEESNRIEGIGRAVTREEIDAHVTLLSRDDLAIEDLEQFVADIAGVGLRRLPGMNVRVGSHRPPPGGPAIEKRLGEILDAAHDYDQSPYALHVAYEALHPFMDGNGRSGRALWAWMMRRQGRDPFALGFLHRWYYDSLGAERGHIRSGGGRAGSTAELYAAIGGYHLSGSDWFLSVYDWERLPSELKARVIDAYFSTGKGWESEEYREAVRAAVGWVKANPR